MNRFWSFRNAEDGVGELTLYGEISETSWFGDEVTPKQFRDDLMALGEISELKIYINSGGGDVFAGDAIYSTLKRHNAHKTVYIDGIAASIASEIAMAGDKIIMPANAMLMIHEASSWCSGNKRQMRTRADVLEKIDDKLCDVYAARTGLEKEEIAALMEAATWMTAEEAAAKGFADEIEEERKIVASIEGSELFMGGQRFALEKFEHMPEIEPYNGGDGQPVKDSNQDALDAQRRQFFETRKKIMEAMGGKEG